MPKTPADKRPRPGRPPIYQEPRDRIELRLPVSLTKAIDAQTDNRTTFIMDAIRQAVDPSAAYRRLDIFNAIIAALTERRSAGSLSVKEYERDHFAITEAYVKKDDEALMRFLARYVPDDPRLTEVNAE